jgi:hypothetical protein
LDFSAGEFKLIKLEAIERDGTLMFFNPSERTLVLGKGRHQRVGRLRLPPADPHIGTAIQLVPEPGVYQIWLTSKLKDWEPEATTFIDVK